MKYGYKRKVLFRNRHAEVVLITWKPGEKTEIHQHGDDCFGAIKVLRGCIFETPYFKRPNGELRKGRTRRYRPGEVIVEKGLGIHQVGNSHEVGCSSQTIHLYSPPAKNRTVKA